MIVAVVEVVVAVEVVEGCGAENPTSYDNKRDKCEIATFFSMERRFLFLRECFLYLR
jgi:hypothetical protein